MSDCPHPEAALTARKDALILRWIAEAPDDFQRRVMDRLERAPNGCWLWTASPRAAYGVARVPALLKAGPSATGGPQVRIHRAVWISTRGPIPWGMILDHDSEHGCRNTRCANPDHLAIASPKQNVYSGRGPAVRNSLKTHCDAGHPISEPSQVTASSLRAGKRDCRICCKRRRDGHVALIQQARALTGLSWSRYERTYGKSIRTARQIIDAEEAQK